MVDTPRSQVYFNDPTTGKWRDGQAPLTITEQIFRDFGVSVLNTLDGGTVSGPVNLNGGLSITNKLVQSGTLTYSGSNVQMMNTQTSISGSNTGQSTVYQYNIPSDNLAAGTPGVNGATYLGVLANVSGPLVTGNRVGIGTTVNITGTTANNSANAYYVGLAGAAVGSVNDGGSSGGGYKGNVYGGNLFAILSSGATYYDEVTGLEIDTTVASGASAGRITGIKIIEFNGSPTQGAFSNIGLSIAASSGVTSAGRLIGISFGTQEGWWDIAPTGTLIGTQAANGGLGPAYTAAVGIDLSAVTFSTAAIRLGATIAASPTDLSQGIQLYPGYGFNVSSGNLNIVAQAAISFILGGSNIGYYASDGLNNMAIGNSYQQAGSFLTVTGTSYKVGANQVVGARDTGWTAMTGTPDKATAYATGSVTLAQLAGRVAQLQASLTAHGLIGA